MSAVVGCATDWSLVAVDRPTGQRIAIPKFSRLAGDRRQRDISQLTVQVPRTAGCCAAVSQLSLWRHDLQAYREGELVWAGPLTYRARTTSGDNITLEAVDRLGWSRVRRLRTTRTLTGEPCRLLLRVLADSLGVEADPIAFEHRLIDTGLTRDLAWAAEDARFAWDIIRVLADSVLDLTMVGTTLRAGTTTMGTTPRGTIHQRHLSQDLAIVEDGWRIATNVAARGELLGVWPPETAGPQVNRTIGLVDAVIDRTDLTTTTALTAAAREAWQQRSSARVAISPDSSGQLLPGSGIAFADLVPGARFRIEAEDDCGSATSTYDLASMSFVIGSGGPVARDAGGRFSTQADAETEQVSVSWAESRELVTT